ncbi:MAG: diaminopimelate decarboxylase, partial [SAR202 cluster bacterium]|nr:diaminopimelate decarboxylase [SAR202 cluster bacterium]
FINAAIAKLVAEEDLGLDVVSGGELAVAKAADVPLDGVYFHGNNKTPDELAFAVDSGIGRIVIDSFYELQALNDIARDRGVTQDVMVR